MSFWWLLAGFSLCTLVAHRAAIIYLRTRRVRSEIAETVPYERITEDYRKPLLIMGDSTGVGVGAARPEDSVAGLLAAHLGATYVENHAVSGSLVSELAAQRDAARLPRYDTILIQAGGNDIIMFHDAGKTARELDALLLSLPPARQVLVLSAGDVGGATVFPAFVRPFHTLLNRSFHRRFARVAKRRGATYVNLYEPPERDPFRQDPGRYLSEDGLHPSSEGYALWFEKIRTHLI